MDYFRLDDLFSLISIYWHSVSFMRICTSFSIREIFDFPHGHFLPKPKPLYRKPNPISFVGLKWPICFGYYPPTKFVGEYAHVTYTGGKNHGQKRNTEGIGEGTCSIRAS